MGQSIKKSCSLALLALTLGGGFASAGMSSSLLWDDFDVLPNGFLGGAATFSSTIYNDPFGQGASFNINPMFSSGSDAGAMFFNSGIGVEQGATISYSGLGDQGGSSLNFAALGAVAFEIDFLLVDQAFDLELIMSGGSGIAFATIEVAAGMDTTATFTLSDLIISPGFDINDVNDVSFHFNLEDSVTASLDFVSTEIRLVVPEPGAFALLGLGGMVMTRRRRAS